MAGFEEPGAYAAAAVAVARFEDLAPAVDAAPAATAAVDDPAPTGVGGAPTARLDDADLASAGAEPARVADLDEASAAGPRRAVAVAALNGARLSTAGRGSREAGGQRGRGAGTATASGARAEGQPWQAGASGRSVVERPDRVDCRPARGGQQAEPPDDADPQAVARAICLRLLADRARTRQELAQALRRKGVPDEAASAVLERFGDVGLIDDGAFAEQWVRSRHATPGLGRRALAVELRRKGVADNLAGEALAEVDAGAEEKRACELVERKLRTMPSDTEEQRVAAGRRLLGMLARKGYGGGTAFRVVREALAARGAEFDELADGDLPDELADGDLPDE